jgi:hypothetical protein
MSSLSILSCYCYSGFRSLQLIETMSSPPPNYDRRDPRYHPQDRGPPPHMYGPPATNQPYAQGQMHSNPSFDHGHMMPPPQHSTTVVINQQPSVQNDRILGSKDGHREWSSGLFSCFDDVGKCMLCKNHFILVCCLHTVT